MRKHIDKQKMKGWQRRSKFATLIKKQRTKKIKFKKAFACQKERFFYQKKRTKDQKILRKSMKKHIDKQKIKGWQRRSKFVTLIKK